MPDGKGYIAPFVTATERDNQGGGPAAGQHEQPGSARDRHPVAHLAAHAAPAALLVVASILFRLPPLLNAPGLNSDVAVVGLQARHLLQGEWSPFLWGSGYQSSVDAAAAALAFALFGARPWVLIASALALHIGLTLCVFVTLRRVGLRAWAAAALCLLVVFTTASVHSYAVNPPREASLTLVFAAVACAAGLRRSARPLASVVTAIMLSGLASYADPYARIALPGIAFYLAWELYVTYRHATRGARVRLMATLAVTLPVAAIPDYLLRHSMGASSGPMGLTLDRVGHNAELLFHSCGPWWLGLETFAAFEVDGREAWMRWDAPWLARLVGVAGSLAYAALLSWGGLALLRALRRRGTNAESAAPARLSALGLAMVSGTCVAFLFSVMVMDHFAMRYLAAATLFGPFAFASLVARADTAPRGHRALGWRALLALHLAATALSGWVSFRPYTAGVLPVRTQVGSGREEADLGRALAARDVHQAMADYWASYRLSFVLEERLEVCPTHVREDRYAPYRVRWHDAHRKAYIHDRLRSRENLDDAAARAATLGLVRERIQVGAYTAFVIE
jgi:hypothetical protein